MLNRIPRGTPPLAMMLEDLGHPSTEALGRALGVSQSTARRWIAAGEAPRPAMLALFWLTSWGLSAIDAEAHNAATMHASMSRLLRDELVAAHRQLGRLLRQPARPAPAANGARYSGEPVPLMDAGSA